jgi:thiol-disulfide isomerase/thioredoxin
MSLNDSISIGPLSLPLILILIAIIASAAYLAGVLSLRKNRQSRRVFGDLLFTPLLPFLIGWKLSLIITDARDVFIDPLLLLYGSGSVVNVLIGFAVSGLWLTFQWHRRKPDAAVNRAMVRALGTALILTLLTTGGMVFSGRVSADREKLPLVQLTGENGEIWDAGMATGSTLVLNFWASWCPPCRAEMPMLDRLQSDPRFSGVTFYAVNAIRTEKNPGDGLRWLEENEIDLPLLYDSSGEAMSVYNIAGLPTTIVVDSEGRVVEQKTGAVSRSWLIAAIRKAK